MSSIQDPTNKSTLATASNRAAEKRAARRAKVLQRGEDRLKILSGQIKSNEIIDNIDQVLNDTVEEFIQEDFNTITTNEDEITAESSTTIQDNIEEEPLYQRVDTKTRRREAAARRANRNEIVQEILDTKQQMHTKITSHEERTEPYMESLVKTKEYQGHFMALKLLSIEGNIILFLIIISALYLACTIDILDLVTDMKLQNTVLTPYLQLMSQGIPLNTIRLQMRRDNLSPLIMKQIEKALKEQVEATSKLNAASTLSFIERWFSLPDFHAWGEYFISFITRPPILLGVLFLRFFINIIFSTIRTAFDLPDVRPPQENDLGWIVNLAFASRPAFKGYIVKFRKATDDALVFLFVFVLTVALRIIFLSRE